MAGGLVTRSALQRRLVANALTKPANVAVPAAMVVGGLLLSLWWLAALAALAYVALALTTFLDEAEAKRVGDAAYGRVTAPGTPPLDPKTLAPPIREQLDAARAEQAGIAKTIAESQLEWADVRLETASLVAALQTTARRAQRVYAYLDGQDRRDVQRRLDAALTPGTRDALREQAAQYDGLASLLRRYYDEMEQVVASLRIVHAKLVRLSVTTDEDAHSGELADDLRGLRDRVDALTAGFDEALKA